MLEDVRMLMRRTSAAIVVGLAGELNLPRALVTEKAFPENEEVILTAVNASGTAGTTDIIHEKRFGMHIQIEVDVPLQLQKQNQTWYGGVVDVSIEPNSTFGID